MCGFRLRCVTMRIYSLNAASIFATSRKPAQLDGALLVESLWAADCSGNPAPPRKSYAGLSPLALAPRRGLREDQRQDPLFVAGGGSRGRDFGVVCHQKAGQICGFEVPEEGPEAPRPSQQNCHRRPAILSCCDATSGQSGPARDGAMAQQSGRKFTSTLPTKRARHAAV